MKLVKTGLIVLAVALTTALSFSVAAAQEAHVHKFVSGQVTSISGDVVILKTEQGTTRNISLKQTQEEMIKELKVGDTLFLELDEGNQIIDIDRLTGEGTLEHARPERHIAVVGVLKKYDKAAKAATLRLPGGQEKTYKFKDASATKMATVKVGSTLLLEIDEEQPLVNDFLISD